MGASASEIDSVATTRRGRTGPGKIVSPAILLLYCIRVMTPETSQVVRRFSSDSRGTTPLKNPGPALRRLQEHRLHPEKLFNKWIMGLEMQVRYQQMGQGQG